MKVNYFSTFHLIIKIMHYSSALFYDLEEFCELLGLETNSLLKESSKAHNSEGWGC